MALPLILPVLLISKKRRKTFLPRLGLARVLSLDQRAGHRSTGGKAIWVHALSVGETRAAISLIRGLADRFGSQPIVFSVSTQTGFDVAKGLFKDRVDEIFFFPYDIPLAIKRAVTRIDPAAVLIVESDIWPNFLSIMKKRQIPVILCNARLSNRSFSHHRRLSLISKPLFSLFTAICAPSEWDARRFIGLGLDPETIHITGNVKFDQDSEPVSVGDMTERRDALKLMPEHRLLLAGSTHRGEEEILLDAYARLIDVFPYLRLMIASRDPTRAGSIERNARAQGLSVSCMSVWEETTPRVGWQVMILDTIGVLNRIYALADITFVGGSLVKAGGHNPLEPAAFSKPILFGPDMSDFQDIANMLIDTGGAVRVDNWHDIHQETDRLLRHPEKASEMGENAFRVFSDNKGAVVRTLDVVDNCLH
ncbi:MAG: 3-deoxy-D-manno-octulosonic acid transferase [Desulfobacterales bacterium]